MENGNRKREVAWHLPATVDNPFRSFQVEAKSIFVFGGCLSCHSDAPGYERDVTRISLRTLDLQIHALNSLPSGPRA